MTKLRGRLSFANVMSVVALFVALGGTGLAASQLGKNSVGTKQLKKNSVTGAKVKNGSLKGKDIVASTLGTVPNANRAASAGHADTAGDSSTLQGSGPSAFVHGDGSVIANRLDMDESATVVPLITLPGIGYMTAQCQPGFFSVLLRNTSGQPMDVMDSENFKAPVFETLPDGHGLVTGTISGETLVLQVATRTATPTYATIVTSLSFAGPKACTAVAQATLAK